MQECVLDSAKDSVPRDLFLRVVFLLEFLDYTFIQIAECFYDYAVADKYKYGYYH